MVARVAAPKSGDTTFDGAPGIGASSAAEREDSMGDNREQALALHREGQAAERHGDFNGAIAFYDRAFKTDMTNIPVLRDLALLCKRTGDLDRAQKSLRALLLQRLDASSGITKADIYFHLADVHVKQGDPSKARAMLERALEADPKHADAKALIAALPG
jgi:tetratricopeptide (TPR) repeat protein